MFTKWKLWRMKSRIMELPHSQDSAYVSQFLDLLAETESKRQGTMAETLNSLGSSWETSNFARTAVPWLRATVLQKYGDVVWVRCEVARFLGQIRHDSAVGDLIMVLADEHSEVRNAAALALSAIDAEWRQRDVAKSRVQELLGWLKLQNDRWEERRAAINTLGFFSEPMIIQKLIEVALEIDIGKMRPSETAKLADATLKSMGVETTALLIEAQQRKQAETERQRLESEAKRQAVTRKEQDDMLAYWSHYKEKLGERGLANELRDAMIALETFLEGRNVAPLLEIETFRIAKIGIGWVDKGAIRRGLERIASCGYLEFESRAKRLLQNWKQIDKALIERRG